ncbi:unnamed protein product [Absidia cylindrospora]
MVTLKDIIKSATQTIRQATPKSTGQGTLDAIDTYLDEHPSQLVTHVNKNTSNSSTPTINTTPSSILAAAANSVANNLTNSSSNAGNTTPTTPSSSGINPTGNAFNTSTTSSGSNNLTPLSISMEDSETNTAIDKLSSELFLLYNTTILTSPLAVTVVSCTPEAQRLHNQQYLLLCFVHALLPLLGPSRIFQMSWWSRALQPILTTAAYTDRIKQQARQIIITSLILEQQIIRIRQQQQQRHHRQQQQHQHQQQDQQQEQQDLPQQEQHHHQEHEQQQQQPQSPSLLPIYATWTVNYYLEWARAYQDREQHQVELLVDQQKQTEQQEQQHEEQQQQQQSEKTGDDIRLQHQALLDMEQEEWSKNLMLILMALGAAETKPFFCLLDGYFQSSQHRLQIVYLLSEFMLRKRTHAHEILETPLFESMLKSLMYDNSTTLIAISVTNMIMLLPRICTSLPPFLPRLFYIFARAISWDQLRDMRKKQHSLTTAPSGKKKIDTDWDCADYTFSKLAAPPSNPQTGPFFTALYGLYPCNFLHFLHKPYAYFEKKGFTVPEEFDEETFRTRTMVQVARHMLHPNLVTMDLETELTDRSRWMKMEPPDVIARIMSLDLTNAASRVAFLTSNMNPDDESTSGVNQQPQQHTNSMDLLDTSLWTATTAQKQQQHDDDDKSDPTLMGVKRSQPPPPPATVKSSPSSSSSPAILDSTSEATKTPMISNILQLHRALKSGTEVLIGDDIWDASLKHMISPVSSTCTSPRIKDGPVAAAALMVDYQNSTANSGSGDGSSTSSSETKLLIAGLKREVLLLRNELNFELFLKQQHLQHIGRLHREHVMDSTVEAERQQLYNTNRMLKAQLSQTTASLEKLKSEAVLTRQKHIKWEDEQSNKLRGYREARKEWQAHMEVANTKINDYQQTINEQQGQLEECRKRIFEVESELQTQQPTLEKATEYQNRVKQLTQQMLLWEEDTTHLKEQKRYIKGLLSQWWSMEELVASLQAENRKLMAHQSQCEKELKNLTNKLSTIPSPSVSSDHPENQQQQQHQQQQQQPPSHFTMFKDTRQAEMDQMKKLMQDLKQQLTISEMDRIRYQAELEQYKAKDNLQQTDAPPPLASSATDPTTDTDHGDGTDGGDGDGDLQQT